MVHTNCSTPNPSPSQLPVWGEHYNCQDLYYSTSNTPPVKHFRRKKFIAEPPLKISTPNFQGKVF